MNTMKKLLIPALLALLLAALTLPVLAAGNDAAAPAETAVTETAETSGASGKAIAAGIAIGLAAAVPLIITARAKIETNPNRIPRFPD